MFRSAAFAAILVLACSNAFAQVANVPPKSEAEVIDRLRAAGQAAIIEKDVDGHLTSVTIQRIFGPPPSLPADLTWLSLCPELEALSMESSVGSTISDEDLKRLNDRLKQLGALPKLRVVALAGCGVSDDGLRHVGAIGQLEKLYINSDSLTGSGLRHLTMCHRLQTLYLAGKALNDDGLASLAELPEIEVFAVCGEKLTDRTLEVVSKLPHLTSLSLGVSGQSTEFSPEGLSQLTAAAKLRTLHLLDAPFDDSFVPALRRITQLESLDLRGSRISENGARTLAAALPNVRIRSQHGDFGPPQTE